MQIIYTAICSSIFIEICLIDLYLQPDMVAHSCNSSYLAVWHSRIIGSRVPGQPGQHRKTPSLPLKKEKKSLLAFLLQIIQNYMLNMHILNVLNQSRKILLRFS